MGCDGNGEENGMRGGRVRGGGTGFGGGEDTADVGGREEVGEEAVEEAEVPGEGDGFEVDEGEEEKEVAKGKVRAEGGDGQWHRGKVEGVRVAVMGLTISWKCYNRRLRILLITLLGLAV